MSIINNLTKGFKNEEADNKYSVYVQFDDDEIILLSVDIDMDEEFIIALHPEDKNYLEIRDQQTNKQIKIFAKKNEK